MGSGGFERSGRDEQQLFFLMWPYYNIIIVYQSSYICLPPRQHLGNIEYGGLWKFNGSWSEIIRWGVDENSILFRPILAWEVGTFSQKKSKINYFRGESHY